MTFGEAPAPSDARFFSADDGNVYARRGESARYGVMAVASAKIRQASNGVNHSEVNQDFWPSPRKALQIRLLFLAKQPQTEEILWVAITCRNTKEIQ